MSEVKIGDYTLDSLASGLSATAGASNDGVKLASLALWTIRYAYICGQLDGATEANKAFQACIERSLPSAGAAVQTTAPAIFTTVFRDKDGDA